MPLTPQDLTCLREAIALAAAARAHGNHPFGALLAVNGEILARAENTVITGADVTQHAELNLVRLAQQQLPQEVLAQAALYTSTEPCPMCSGAIYWAGIPRVVYACSEETLYGLSGGGLALPCREVFARGARPVQVLGPLLEEEAIQPHLGFWQAG
ncbi:MAG: nucleoside deaminase [Chloroflexi bacterium]|nr:nucleoside deaminase [Chloroflexota bacterium]